MSLINAFCPHCRTYMEVPALYFGKSVRCDKCGLSYVAEGPKIEKKPSLILQLFHAVLYQFSLTKGFLVRLGLALLLASLGIIVVPFSMMFFQEWNLNRAQKHTRQNSQSIASEPSGPVVQNSSWDSGVPQVKDWLKANANDAKSIEYVEWSEVQPNGKGFMVRCKYRAKNAFGAYVLRNTLFHLDSDGNVIAYKEL